MPTIVFVKCHLARNGNKIKLELMMGSINRSIVRGGVVVLIEKLAKETFLLPQFFLVIL